MQKNDAQVRVHERRSIIYARNILHDIAALLYITLFFFVCIAV